MSVATRYRQVFYALVIAVGLAGCASMGNKREPLSVTVSDVRMGTAGVLEQQYYVKLRVQNPNDVAIEVKGLSFELELNGKSFAKGVGGQAVTVPGFGSELVEVEAVSGLGGILRRLGAMSGGDGSLRYHLEGRLVTTNAGTIAFDEQGYLKLNGDGAAK